MRRDIAWTIARATAAIEYRMLGYTYDQIAEELGYASKSGAYNAVKRALTRRLDNAVDQYRFDTLARLDYMQTQLWSKVHQGDEQAIEINRKIVKQRVQLLGHDGLLEPIRKQPVLKHSQHDNHEHFHML